MIVLPMKPSNKYTIATVWLLISLPITGIFAQDQEEDDLGTQQVTVTKSYTPSLSDAFKLSTESIDVPSLLPAPKNLEFTPKEVEVVSTFVPNKASPLKLQRKEKTLSSNSQLSFGLGNLGQIYFDAAVRAALDSQQALGLDVFVEREGGVPNTIVPSDRNQTEVAATHQYNTSQFSALNQLGFQATGAHYYGLYTEETPVNDPLRNDLLSFQQQFYSVYVKSRWQWYDKWLEKIHAKVRYAGDLFGTTEQAADVLTNIRIPLFNAYVDIQPQINFLQTNFEQGYFTRAEEQFSQSKAGVQVQLSDVRKKFKYKIGAKAHYLIGDTSSSTSAFYVYPEVFMAYSNPNKKIQPYISVTGNLRLNSYYSAFSQNPFVAPALELRPTDEKYQGELGFTTLFKSGVEFKLAGRYSYNEQFALFQRYALDPQVTENGYRLANAFGWVYDDVTKYGAIAGLKYRTKNQSEIQIELLQNAYDLAEQPKAWNLPALEAKLNANLTLTSKLKAYFSVNFMGSRAAAYRPVLLQQAPEFNQAVVENLSAVTFLKAEMSYHLFDQWLLFARYRSAFGAQPYRWSFYPVNQNLVLLGARYKLNINL